MLVLANRQHEQSQYPEAGRIDVFTQDTTYTTQ
jgi:hypothetical protein